MKKSTFLLSCCMVALSATAASAAGVYVGGNLGFAVPPTLTATEDNGWSGLAADVSFSSGLALTAAVGYDFDSFRVEGEFGYQQNNSDDTDWSITAYNNTATFATTSILNGNLAATTWMVNGYYDFKNNSPFTPFLGAGIGYAKVELNDITSHYYYGTYSVDDSVFAYQFMAGCSYNINKNIAIDLSYRYVASSNPTFTDGLGGSTDFEFKSHNFLLGGRYTF